MAQKTTLAAILILLTLILCGCSPTPISELYSLPQLSEEYISLQTLIDSEISSGSEYSSPVRGTHRQSVQLYDINGDGQSEALAFFRTTDGSLKINIYGYSNNAYSSVCTIMGEAASIGRIEFADMNSDGCSELIVSWQMGGDITMLNVYSMRAWSGSVLLTADCSGFVTYKMDESDATMLMLLRHDTEEQGFVDMYTLKDGEMQASSAQLSRGFSTVTRLTCGALSDGTPTVFVEGTYMQSHTITDVLIADSGELYNITADKSGISPTTRSFAVYSEDIDNDGALEIPSTRRMSPQGDGLTEYWLFDWSRVEKNGKTKHSKTTFHCYSDGWYLVIPDELRYTLSVRREDRITGERVVVVSMYEDEKLIDLMSIYTLSGENRHDRAELGNRMILKETETTVYAVRFNDDAINAEVFADSFHLILSDWISPVM